MEVTSHKDLLGDNFNFNVRVFNRETKRQISQISKENTDVCESQSQ